MQPRYRFSASHRLEAPREFVHGVLVDLEYYCGWWMQVRGVAKIDDDTALVVCHSALPYDLELLLTARSRALDLLEVQIEGPIRGFARYHLVEAGPGVTSLQFEQEVRAESRLMVLASHVARPLLVWNHHRMMRGSERGLRALLERGQPSAATAAS